MRAPGTQEFTHSQSGSVGRRQRSFMVSSGRRLWSIPAAHREAVFIIPLLGWGEIVIVKQIKPVSK